MTGELEKCQPSTRSRSHKQLGTYLSKRSLRKATVIPQGWFAWMRACGCLGLVFDGGNVDVDERFDGW